MTAAQPCALTIEHLQAVFTACREDNWPALAEFAESMACVGIYTGLRCFDDTLAIVRQHFDVVPESGRPERHTVHALQIQKHDRVQFVCAQGWTYEAEIQAGLRRQMQQKGVRVYAVEPDGDWTSFKIASDPAGIEQFLSNCPNEIRDAGCMARVIVDAMHLQQSTPVSTSSIPRTRI